MATNNNRKIAWVTPDYFVDCDFNPEILGKILQHYSIHWIVLFPKENARFSEADFEPLKHLDGLTIEFKYSNYRQRDPRRLAYYFDIFLRIRSLNPDVVYLNCVPDPYFLPALWLLDKRKSIICAHDGEVNGGFDFKLITKLSFNWSFRFFRNVCMFSASQAAVFQKRFQNAKVTIINLSLKSFGNSEIKKPWNKIVFLSFGVINYSKNIELLLDAACNVYDKGYKNIRVSINGRCDNWEFYESRMKYPHIFHFDIKIIDNSKISELFTSAHYFVQPYRHMSQSGAMKVAFNYNVPVIASDLPGFVDEITEGINGFLFKSEDIQDLERQMINVIEQHSSYEQLAERMSNYVCENYSSSVIGEKYVAMFKSITNV